MAVGGRGVLLSTGKAKHQFKAKAKPQPLTRGSFVGIARLLCRSKVCIILPVLNFSFSSLGTGLVND